MKNYALIDILSGRINGVLGMSPSETYYDGAEISGQLCKELPANLPPEVAVESKRWNGAAFVDMPPKPNDFYDWNINEWAFNSVRFDEEARAFRNATLSACDWTQVPDAPITAEKVEEWKVYRQALRDLPTSWGDARSLDEIIWPTKPV